MTLSRNILYNHDLSPEDTVLALLGLPLDEGVNPGDLFEITQDGVLNDVDTRTMVPPGHYSVTSAEDNLVHMVSFNPARKTYGGKEFSVHATDMEQYILSGCVRFHEYLGEGRYKGSVEDPRQIRAMFVKGYLKKKDRADGGTDLKYARRSFPRFQSGTPNPEHKINRARHARKIRRQRRKKLPPVQPKDLL